MLEDQLEDILESLKQAKQSGGKIDIAEAFMLVHKATGAIAMMLLMWADDDGFENLVLELEDIYDRRIKPIDIPGLNRFIEPTVDGKLKRMIRPMLEKLRAHLANK